MHLFLDCPSGRYPGRPDQKVYINEPPTAWPCTHIWIDSKTLLGRLMLSPRKSRFLGSFFAFLPLEFGTLLSTFGQ